MELIFASQNPHKTKEIAAMLPAALLVKSLADIGFHDDIPEYGETLRENAAIKARGIWNLTKKNCFADDTGLMVDALNGEPGVHSARYAGEEKDAVRNMKKLLENMEHKANRSAHFITVICLILEGTECFFEGRLDGEIIEAPMGTEGFGYDPVFRPVGMEQTLAQLNAAEKNRISHRYLAIARMAEFLAARLNF